MIEARFGKDGTQPHFFDSARRSVEFMIHIKKRRRSATQHFKTCQLGPPIDILLGQLGFVRPDHLFEPWHQRHIIAIAAKERHGRMRMGIDKSRDDGLASPVNYRIGRPVDHRCHLRYSLPLDQKIRRPAVPFDGLNQDAHGR